MSEKKHQPAPWVYSFFDKIIFDNDGEVVCDTMSTGEDHEEASAHLIAAAPEMYMELQQISLWLQSKNMGDWRDIEKLLAKARGE